MKTAFIPFDKGSSSSADVDVCMFPFLEVLS